MAHEINRKQLNYMNATIKYYDDGSEILQSYNTDVVKKTPDGMYIRLWDGWSSSTMKQVKTYCGYYFRELPFADGTHEDLRKESRRTGYDITGRIRSEPISFWISRRLSEIQQAISDVNLNGLVFSYNSACTKELKKIYKNNPKVLRLLAAIKICSVKEHGDTVSREEKKYQDIAMAAKLYEYNFEKLWTIGGLYKEYPDWNAMGAFDTLVLS